MDSVIGWILLVAVVIGGGYVLLRIRAARTPSPGAPAVVGAEARRPPAEFHVVGKEARVLFDVPLPPEGADPVLRELLLHHAAELMRDRRRRGQPLDEVELIRVSAKSAGSAAEVGVIELVGPNELPQIARPAPLARTVGEDHDPLRSLSDSEVRQVTPPADADRQDDLAPIGEDLRLTAGLAAGLRSLGVAPEEMSVTELGLGLLDLAGYSVTPRRSGTYVATGGGTSTFVSFVPHEPGSYPELGASAITEFLVGFSTARTERGLLITDKFGPYAIYDKERANPRCRFITRERLQAFVDSIALS